MVYRFIINRDPETVRHYMTKAADESRLMGIVDYSEYHATLDELHVFFDANQESEGIRFLNLFMRFQELSSDCTHIRVKLTYRLMSTQLVDMIRHHMSRRIQLKYIVKSYAINLKRKIESRA